MSAGDTKEARTRRVAERPLPPRQEVRDDGPLLRAALQWAYIHVYDEEGRPVVDVDLVRVRMADYLGVDVASIGHSERKRPCYRCSGRGTTQWTMGRGIGTDDTCPECDGSRVSGFDFTQLPDKANDGKALPPRERLEFFMQCPDVTKLPRALWRSVTAAKYKRAHRAKMAGWQHDAR